MATIPINRYLLNVEKFFQRRIRKHLNQTSIKNESTFTSKQQKLPLELSIPTEKINSCPSKILRPQNEILGITNEEYHQRRIKLLDAICSHSVKSEHIIIMPGSPRRYMIDKIPYLFRQDTDMLYLSGCHEQDCVLVIHSLPDRKPVACKVVMFTPPYDPSKELWDGPCTRDSAAPATWGVDEGLPSTELSSYLESVEQDLGGKPDIWYNFLSPPNAEIHKDIHKWILKGRMGKLSSPKSFIHSLRWIKSPAEISLMRETCRISSESIAATMMSCSPSSSEHQLFAMVDYECRMRGADYLAYPPVVAGGERTNIIHYINNNKQIKHDELILMDAGSEYKGYTGDITRTWPLSGKFSPAQRDLYEAVLEVQNHVISQCANSRPSLKELFVIMCEKMGSVLQEICLLPQDLPKNQLSQAAYGFCPHHVSHYLGMDVHDTPLVSSNNKLSPGCIITVEPGIYVTKKGSRSRYSGLGVRIEDDILITETGIEVLSKDCPKSPDEVEKLVGSSL